MKVKFRPLILLAFLLLSICFPPVASAQSSSQVVSNAQRIFDESVDCHGSFASYLSYLERQRLSYQLTLNNAQFYNQVYNTVVDYSSACLNIAISILKDGGIEALKTVGEEAFSLVMDSFVTDMPDLSLSDFIYSQADAGLRQAQIGGLMEIGLKVENECGGRFKSVEDAVAFLTEYQNIKTGLAAAEMGRSFYYDQLNASPFDTLHDIFFKSTISLVDINKSTAGRLQQLGEGYTRDKVLNIVADMFRGIAEGANNKHVTTWANKVIEITSETQRLVSFDIDDFGKNQDTSQNGNSNTGNDDGNGNTSVPGTNNETVYYIPQNQPVYYKKSQYIEGLYYGGWSGSRSNGHPEGFGTLTYSGFDDGAFFNIQIDGKTHKAIYYQGYFSNGFRMGQGTVLYEDGWKEEGTYFGAWASGKVVFRGRFWHKNGIHYLDGYLTATSGIGGTWTWDSSSWQSNAPSLSVVQEINKKWACTIPANYPLKIYNSPTEEYNDRIIVAQQQPYHISGTKRYILSDGSSRCMYIANDGSECYFFLDEIITFLEESSVASVDECSYVCIIPAGEKVLWYESPSSRIYSSKSEPADNSYTIICDAKYTLEDGTVRYECNDINGKRYLECSQATRVESSDISVSNIRTVLYRSNEGEPYGVMLSWSSNNTSGVDVIYVPYAETLDENNNVVESTLYNEGRESGWVWYPDSPYYLNQNVQHKCRFTIFAMLPGKHYHKEDAVARSESVVVAITPFRLSAVTGDNASPNAVRLSWDSTGYHDYEIYRMDETTGQSFMFHINASAVSGEKCYFDDYPTHSGLYRYHIIDKQTFERTNEREVDFIVDINSPLTTSQRNYLNDSNSLITTSYTVDGKGVTITWNNIKTAGYDFSNYVIERCNGWDEDNAEWENLTPFSYSVYKDTTTSHYTDTSIQPRTCYSYRVRFANRSASSEIMRICTLDEGEAELLQPTTAGCETDIFSAWLDDNEVHCSITGVIDDDATIFIAQYIGGKMIDIVMSGITTLDKSSMVIIPIEYNPNSTYRAFLLDATLRPLSTVQFLS